MRQLIIVALTSAAVYCVSADADDTPSHCNSTVEYACANERTCIALELVNNSVNDCGDNSDEVSIPCPSSMFSCSNGRRCALMEWVLDGKDDCLDASDEAKLVGTNCSTAVDCCFCDDYVAHSSCVNQLCQCDDGYHPNQQRTACQPRVVGDLCTSTVDCSVLEGGLCAADGRCRCSAGHFTLPDSFMCTSRSLGDGCSTDEDCSAVVDHSRCDDVTMTCQCDVIAGYRQLDDGACDIRELGDLCETDDDCQEAIENSWCMSDSPEGSSIAETSDGSCVCQHGFRQDGQLLCRYHIVGDTCTTESQCTHSINNSRCWRGYCSCLPGHRRDIINGTSVNTTCVRRVIGDACHVNTTDCSDAIEFSECVEVNDSAICRCDEEHMSANNGTNCDIRPTLAPYVPVVGPEWEKCGPDATCRGVNERCLTIGVSPSDADEDERGRRSSSSSSLHGQCLCVGGFSRCAPDQPCRRARAFEVRLNCSSIAGRFDLLPLSYWGYMEAVGATLEIQRWETNCSDRLQYSGMDVILSESADYVDGYLMSQVVQFDDATAGRMVTFAVYVEFNSTTQPHEIETIVRNFLNRSDGEVGSSRIFVDRPFEHNLLVSDLDECYSWKLTSSLNDCHDNASCDNLLGYFDCVCNVDFKDISTDKHYLGRRCVAVDKGKVSAALEKTFKTAGCSDGACETSWDVVLIITSSVFAVLVLLLVVELVWRTRQLRREVMKRQLRKSAEPKSSKQAQKRAATRLAAVSFNPTQPFNYGDASTQPLLVSSRRSLPQSKHALARKSSQHDNLKRPLVNAGEDCAHRDSNVDKLA